MIIINKPQFEISEKALNLVTLITEKLTKLELSIDKRKDLYLRKISKIKSVNSSCAIEANTLTEEDVISVINGKTVLATQNEINEVKNAYNAYHNINNYDPYDIKSFLKAHKILTTDLINESGKFRSGDVGVFDGNKVIHMGARPEFVPKLVEELFIWAKASNLNPLIKSSVVHFEIEFIHPFNDGNGRIGRLWQSLILYQYNKIFEFLPIETLVFENQKQYYDALSKSENDASSTLFIEYMLDMILQTIEKFESNSFLTKVKDKYIFKLSPTEKEILNKLIPYFDKYEFINNEKASEVIEKKKGNTRKYFGRFVKLGLLIPIGNNKGRKYKINNEVYK